uniref:Uncharacterized protein n=1 Tax=Caenorhabditis tropicalis TaxID=1561998 RepID=A0A1I7T4L5_9PELO
MSLNHALVTRIVEVECGFRDKEPSPNLRRKKRSHIVRGIIRLSKWFLRFYQRSKQVLKPELLRGIKNVVDKLHHIKTPIGKVKFGGIGSFFYEMWKDVDKIRLEAKDDHLDSMLEQTLRISIQLLMNNGELSEILLNHPIILDKIKRYLPISNGQLLSTVSASDAICHRLPDSRVEILMKLKIPIIENAIVEKCDDIGKMNESVYQYYDLPTATFHRNGSSFGVNLEKCGLEDFVFCPLESVHEVGCSKYNLEQCELKEAFEKDNFKRELQIGFAVYGDFTQILARKDGLNALWKVNPHQLYYIIPQSGATISVGGNELKQATKVESTVIRPME